MSLTSNKFCFESLLHIKTTLEITGDYERGPNDVGKTLGFEADGQEGILETSLLRKGGLLKHRDRTPGQKERHWGREEWPVAYFQIGRG